jgi:hypothetical protein
MLLKDASEKAHVSNSRQLDILIASHGLSNEDMLLKEASEKAHVSNSRQLDK